MTDILDNLVAARQNQTAGKQAMFIPAGEAASAAESLNMDPRAFLMALLPAAVKYSRPAISSFPVGAIAMGFPQEGGLFGNVYFGASFEVAHETLTVVVHGEQSAIQNAFCGGETGLKYLAINASPCGYCRQFIWEINTKQGEIEILLSDASQPGGYSTETIAHYLPDAFGPAALGFPRALLEPCDNGIKDTSSDPLEQLAIDQANHCYSPYTKTFSSVALKTGSGFMAAGRYAENAAYNPSMVPMMAALSQLNLSLAPQANLDIQDAVLAEMKTKVSMKDQSTAILAALQPGTKLRFVDL